MEIAPIVAVVEGTAMEPAPVIAASILPSQNISEPARNLIPDQLELLGTEPAPSTSPLLVEDLGEVKAGAQAGAISDPCGALGRPPICLDKGLVKQLLARSAPVSHGILDSNNLLNSEALQLHDFESVVRPSNTSSCKSVFVYDPASITALLQWCHRPQQNVICFTPAVKKAPWLPLLKGSRLLAQISPGTVLGRIAGGQPFRALCNLNAWLYNQ